MFTIAANFVDPDAYFIGGGVTDTGAEFRTRFMERVRAATQLRDEQAKVATFAIVPDLDKAGARGSALGGPACNPALTGRSRLRCDDAATCAATSSLSHPPVTPTENLSLDLTRCCPRRDKDVVPSPTAC